MGTSSVVQRQTVRLTIGPPARRRRSRCPSCGTSKVPQVDWAGRGTSPWFASSSSGDGGGPQTALAEAKAAGAAAVVLDLRNGPGGLVDEAVGGQHVHPRWCGLHPGGCGRRAIPVRSVTSRGRTCR
jgi:hypothetical protein